MNISSEPVVVRTAADATLAEFTLGRLAEEQGWPILDSRTQYGADSGGVFAMVHTTRGIAKLRGTTGGSFWLTSYMSRGSGILYCEEGLPADIRALDLPYGTFLELVAEHKLDTPVRD